MSYEQMAYAAKKAMGNADGNTQAIVLGLLAIAAAINEQKTVPPKAHAENIPRRSQIDPDLLSMPIWQIKLSTNALTTRLQNQVGRTAPTVEALCRMTDVQFRSIKNVGNGKIYRETKAWLSARRLDFGILS